MKPIGPLMWEHRLIEEMLQLVEKEVDIIRKKNKLNPFYIDTVVDFIRVYADRTHHGKEEDILFKSLGAKPLSKEHKQIMEELIAEHIYSRQTVAKLVAAKEQYINGEVVIIDQVVEILMKLVEFYPEHIKKEDKAFFFPVMDYFAVEEQQEMLHAFWEFDRKMIHEKYRNVLGLLKNYSILV
jgi:hemerythrin-like domain-containing protein